MTVVPEDPSASLVAVQAARAERAGEAPTRRSIARVFGTFQLMARYDLKARYAPTLFGLGWAVVQPLALLGAYLFGFALVMGSQGRGADRLDLVLYQMCGFFPWMSLAEGLSRAGASLSDNRALLRKVVFAGEVLPAVAVVNASLVELLGICGIVGVAVGSGRGSAWVLTVPLILALRLAFTLGLGWLASIAVAYVRDLGQALGLTFTVWLFLTPVFYPEASYPAALRWTLHLNPLWHVARAYRAAILEGRSPMPELGWLSCFSVLTLALGWLVFGRTIGDVKSTL